MIKHHTRPNYKSHDVQEYIWIANALIHEHRPGVNVSTVTHIKNVINMNIDKTLNKRLLIAIRKIYEVGSKK